MKIYIAASFGAKARMRVMAQLLQKDGHQVTSRWLLGPSVNGMNAEGVEADPVRALRGAITDLEDIEKSDLVAIFTETPSSSGGLHVELGYSIARRKDIAVIGPRPNVFFTWPRIQMFRTVEEFMNYLKG